MTREEAINLIGGMKSDLSDFYDDNDLTALDMALASLKTDEAYQLEYENRDFVEISKGMTNGDIIKTLFPKIDDNFSNVIDLKLWWNAPYQKGGK